MPGLFTSILAGLTLLPASYEPPGMERRGGKRKRRARGVETEFTSYYGRPVIKKPHWVWPIWTYFWAGGIAGGVSAIGVAAELWGDKEKDASIIKAARYISLAGGVVSPVLLIIDLQRPQRFLNMLRVLKLRSPLSTGTWILSSLGMLIGVNAARQVVEDGFISAESLPGKLALLSSNKATRILQGVDGIALGTYTGVLLSATAVPLWANADEAIAPLFLSSAFSTGAAAITLARALAGVPVEDLHRLEPIERTAILSELSCLAYAYSKLTPENRKHVVAGKHTPGFLLAVGLGMVGPLIMQLLSPKKGVAGRIANIVTSLMVLTGGYFLRYASVEAGKDSADDPDAYHSITRGPGRASPEEQAKRYASSGEAKPFEAGRSTPEARPNLFKAPAPPEKIGPSPISGTPPEDSTS